VKRGRGRALVLVAGLAGAAFLACGGGDGGDAGDSATNTPQRTTAPTATEPATATSTIEPAATPTLYAVGETFLELRDGLAEALDSIGANIGAVPPDIRADLVARCQRLARFAAEDEVNVICDAIERAMDRGDPGLIELVLENLVTLEED
jgi:hypothetical protein